MKLGAMPLGPRVLAQSAVAVSHTGDLLETTLATITLPGGALGANGQIEIVAAWRSNNGTSTKTMRIKFGALTVLDNSMSATQQSAQGYTRIGNANDAAVQRSHSAGNVGFSINSAAGVDGTVDTSQDVSITITGQLANAGDTITLQSYLVTLYPKA